MGFLIFDMSFQLYSDKVQVGDIIRNSSIQRYLEIRILGMRNGLRLIYQG